MCCLTMSLLSVINVILLFELTRAGQIKESELTRAGRIKGSLGMGGSDFISGLCWFVGKSTHSSLHAPKPQPRGHGQLLLPFVPIQKLPRRKKNTYLQREHLKNHSLLLLTRGGERERGRDVSAVRGARGPSACRASGASLPSPPDKPCVPIPSDPAARARRRAGPRGGVVLPARRARLRGRQGRRPGRRVLPRQGGQPRIFLASGNMVAAPWRLSPRAIKC